MKCSKHILSFLIISCFALFGKTNPLFDQGLKDANEKKYNDALKSFEKVIQSEPGNVSAYFNLGNCYFELKKYGKAIWAYERVIKFSPKDSEAPMNIELAYKKLASDVQWTPHTSRLQRLIYSIGTNTWSILSVCISILMGISIFYLFHSKNSPWKRLHFMLLFGETIIIMACVVAGLSSANYLETERFALVTKHEIPVFLNNQKEKASFILKEGTKVEIIGLTKQSLLNVRLNDGKTVLVNSDDLDKI